MLTKQPRITITPGTARVYGRRQYTVCAPATPRPPSGGGGGGSGQQVCEVICRPREDIGMGGTTTVCGTSCYWQS